MARVNSKEFEKRFSNAVKFIWAKRGAGQKVKSRDVLDEFHVSHSYGKIFDQITGEEEDILSLCNRLIAEAREVNRNHNHREPSADLFNPETLREEAQKLLKHNVETPQEVDIDRLRAEIREEVINELRDRDKEYAKSRRYNVAFGVLTSLIPVRHKDRPDEIAKRAVRIADEFLEELNKTE